MNADYICPKLKELVKLMYCSRNPPRFNGTYARELEDGSFTFGTRTPLTRNTVTRPMAIFLITTKLPKDDKEEETD